MAAKGEEGEGRWAQDFEETRRRIEEIEERALAKLRSSSRSARLAAFMGDADDENRDEP